MTSVYQEIEYLPSYLIIIWEKAHIIYTTLCNIVHKPCFIIYATLSINPKPNVNPNPDPNPNLVFPEHVADSSWRAWPSQDQPPYWC